MNTNNRRKLLSGIVALLVVVLLLVGSTYLVRQKMEQNYKRTHYVTVRMNGRDYQFTQERVDLISQDAQKAMDEQRKLAKLHRHYNGPID